MPATFRRLAAGIRYEDARLEDLATAPADAQGPIRLTMHEELGWGRIGKIHAGHISLTSDETEGIDVVVKLCFDLELERELFNEAAVYKHLDLHGVKGVPRLLGLFHDVDIEGPSILILSRGGINLTSGPISRKQR